VCAAELQGTGGGRFLAFASGGAESRRMDHKNKSSRSRSRRVVVEETALPAPSGRRLWLRVLPAIAVAAGVLAFQAVRSDRRDGDSGPALSAAERSTRALLSERTAAHLRALRPH